jgi:hypothetical protein
MIQRIRRSRPWFGAVAALLLLALPVQADDIEPEPYVEENREPEPEVESEWEVEAEQKAETQPAAAASNRRSVGSKIFDCAVLRPFGFAATILGAVFFVPAAALAAPSGAAGVQPAWDVFVGAPVENTFKRPLGDF